MALGAPKTIVSPSVATVLSSRSRASTVARSLPSGASLLRLSCSCSWKDALESRPSHVYPPESRSHERPESSGCPSSSSLCVMISYSPSPLRSCGSTRKRSSARTCTRSPAWTTPSKSLASVIDSSISPGCSARATRIGLSAHAATTANAAMLKIARKTHRDGMKLVIQRPQTGRERPEEPLPHDRTVRPLCQRARPVCDRGYARFTSSPVVPDGSRIRIVVPSPSTLVAPISPPCARTISWLIASPSPAPGPLRSGD